MNEQRVAIITGVSSGIGRASALVLNHVGFTVYGGARRVERMADLEPLGIRTQRLDVTVPADNAALVERVLSEQGRIDVLVNNAGYGEFGALEEVPIDRAKRQFDVNVFGLANFTQLVLPTLRAQGSGRIINISSIGGRIYTPMGGWYYATKHAVEVYSDVLRMEVKQFGIDVAVIEPSGTRTEWGQIAVETGHASTAATSPYQAFGQLLDGFGSDQMAADTPQDVAWLVYKAATDKHPRLRYLPGLNARILTGLARHATPRVYQGVLGRILNYLPH
jgi:short-subunit dehydrogenase